MALLLGEHAEQLFVGQVLVAVLEDHALEVKAARLLALELVGRGVSHHEHRRRHHVAGAPQQPALFLMPLEDVADVARADPQGMSRNHGVLRRTHDVLEGKQRVSLAGAAGSGARKLEGAPPAANVDAEDEDERRLGDEGLVVAGVGKRLLEGGVARHDDAVELLVAGSGRLAGGL